MQRGTVADSVNAMLCRAVWWGCRTQIEAAAFAESEGWDASDLQEVAKKVGGWCDLV